MVSCKSWFYWMFHHEEKPTPEGEKARIKAATVRALLVNVGRRFHL